MELLNLSGFTVDENGRVSFSGLSSGLDFRTIVGGIMAAKRIPVDILEARITENTDKIAALQDLRALLDSLRTSLDDLRGAITFKSAGDTFAAKSVFATTSRIDGSAPSAAGNLLGVSVTNAAALGSHTLEVLRVAAQHKVASQSFADETAALGLAGSFEITGSGGSATITVSSTDTLQDIRDRINNANTGASATEVSASIVEISSTEFVLSITADETGQFMAITEVEGGTVLSGLGVSSTFGSGGTRNGLASSKIEVADGIDKIVFDGTQSDAPYQIKYDQASKTMTVTLLDGTGSESDTFVLTAANGTAETATFTVDGVGITIEIGTGFDKDTDITVAADVFNQNGNAGTIDAASIEIIGSAGDISGITSSTLTFDVTTPAAAIISVGSFTSAAFDATATGLHDVTLTDGTNSLTIRFDITVALDAAGPPTITLNELENVVAAAADTNFDNELQEARTARFTADGLLDPDRYESQFIASGAVTLSSLISNASDPGTFDIQVGADTVTVNYDSTVETTLNALVTKINTEITSAANGVTTAGTAAILMTDGDGVRLVITNTNGSAITLADTSGLLDDLGVDNDQVIERTGNTVSDLFAGITLTLFGSEEGTTVKLDIEQDLGASKTQILDVVDAYNALQIFINQNSLIDPTTGETTEETGALFGASILANIDQQLSTLLVQGVSGVNDAYSILGQIGITLIDRNQDDPLLDNTLEVDETVLDEALLNNPDDVRRLFAFDFSASDPRIALINFTGKTSFDAAGYTVNLNFDDTFRTDAFTDAGSFTQVNAQDGGPASDGISAIVFDDDVLSGNAYRYSYDVGGGELLTLEDLTTGTSQTVDITALIDAVAGVGLDLGAGQTVDVGFSTLGVTITLSGDSGFLRGTDITTGDLDTTGLPGTITMGGTNGAVALPTSGMDSDTVDALRLASEFNTTSGLLTLGLTSSTSGEVHFDAGTDVKFRVDGGSILSDISSVDLDDALEHTIDIYVNDGVSDVMVATLDKFIYSATAASSGNITIDLGTGLFAETSDVVSELSPMENYMTAPALVGGQFNINDSVPSVLSTVTYSPTDSLQDLATAITASHADLTASIVTSGGTFQLQIVHSSRDTLTFDTDTGNILTHLNLANVGDGVFSANINGAADGTDDASATVSGRTITATSKTTAEGLSVFYTGTVDLAATQIDFTVGFAASIFFELQDILDPTSGILETEIDALTDQNTARQSRIDITLARLELQRQALLSRFFGLESALLAANNLRDSITATFEALTNSQRR